MLRVIAVAALLFCVPVQAERGWKNSRREAARQVEPVATTKWIGGTSTDWDTAGNWSNGIPANGDTVLVDSSAGRDLLLNVDRTGDNAGAGLDLAVFHVDSTTTVDVGSSASPLKFCGDLIKNKSPEGFYFQSKTGTGGLFTDRVVQNGSGVFEISTISNASGGQITTLDVLDGSGTVNHNDAGAITRIFILNRNPSAVVELLGTGPIIDVYMDGGIVHLSGSLTITRFRQSGGELTWDTGTMSYTQTGGIAYFNSPGGTFEVFLLRGVLDATQTSGTKTITSLYRDTENHVLIKDSTLLAATITEFGE